mgnify:CR=1 FL=1
MFVTEIRPLNKKKSRILFDDGEDLVLYNGEIRASRIKEQEELPDEVYEKLAGEVLTKRAKHRAMYLLLGQMRTKKELEDKLRKDGYPERAIEEAVSYVESFHYIDDRAYVEQYLAGSGAKKGKKAVLYALAQKGVDRELVESVLEEQEDARDEYELAKVPPSQSSARRTGWMKRVPPCRRFSDAEGIRQFRNPSGTGRIPRFR